MGFLTFKGCLVLLLLALLLMILPVVPQPKPPTTVPWTSTVEVTNFPTPQATATEVLPSPTETVTLVPPTATQPPTVEATPLPSPTPEPVMPEAGKDTWYWEITFGFVLGASLMLGGLSMLRMNYLTGHRKHPLKKIK